MTATFDAELEYLDDIRDPENPRFIVFVFVRNTGSSSLALPAKRQYSTTMDGHTFFVEFSGDEGPELVSAEPGSTVSLSFTFPYGWGEPREVSFRIAGGTDEYWTGEVHLRSIRIGEMTIENTLFESRWNSRP